METAFIKFVLVGLFFFVIVIFQALKKAGKWDKELDDPGLEKRLEEAIRQAKQQTSMRRASSEPPVSQTPREFTKPSLPPMPAKDSRPPRKPAFEFKVPEFARAKKEKKRGAAATPSVKASSLQSGLRPIPTHENFESPEESHAMPVPESQKKLAAQFASPEKPNAASHRSRRANWRRAVVMREVLMPPLALRREGAGRFFDRR